MAYTPFSHTKHDPVQEALGFGEPVNVSRYDQHKYDIFEKMIEKQLSFFWRAADVDVSGEGIDFQALPEHE
ncbi:class Ia ribonucleoside-diphosphate reductase subunit beta, partial [Enterobacter hormaechei]